MFDFNVLDKKVTQARQRAGGNKNLLILENDTTNQVRIVPSKEIGSEIFKSIYVHYSGGGIVPKSMLSPKTYGEVDSVQQYVDGILAEQSLSKEEFKVLKNMEPREAFVTTAVLKGKESEGTKLWVLSVAQLEALRDILKATFHPDPIPNIMDVDNGYDIKIDVVSKEKSDTNQRKVKFQAIARNATPLADNKEAIEKLLEEQPSWEDVYPLATNKMLVGYIQAYENEDDPEEENSQTYGSTSGTNDDVSEEENERLKKAMEELESMDDDNEVHDEAKKEVFVEEPSVEEPSVEEPEEEEPDDDDPF